MREIRTREELVALARELGVRPDWHEPDEQAVTAELRGTPGNFDNAMGVEWYGHAYGEPRAELHVVLRHLDDGDGPGVEIAAVNLANLFAWATGHEAQTPADRQRALNDRLDPEGAVRRQVAQDVRHYFERAVRHSATRGVAEAALVALIEHVYEDVAGRIERREL